MSDFQAFMFSASSLLTFHSSRSIIFTLLHVCLGLSVANLPPASNFQHLLERREIDEKTMHFPCDEVYRMMGT